MAGHRPHFTTELVCAFSIMTATAFPGYADLVFLYPSLGREGVPCGACFVLGAAPTPNVLSLERLGRLIKNEVTLTICNP